MTNEELIQEAKKRYPIGSVVSTLMISGYPSNENETIDNDKWRVCGMGQVALNDMIGCVYTGASEIKKPKWAEVVKYPIFNYQIY